MRRAIVSLIAISLTQFDLCPPPAPGPADKNFVVYPPVVSGPSSTAFDVVFIGEGFTASIEDTTRFREKLHEAIGHLNTSPYKKCAFNFYAVRLVSNESGADHPLDDPPTFKDTPLGAHFGDPNSSSPYHDKRFLLLDDTTKTREAVALATQNYDQIVVLVNDSCYGGLAYEYLRILTVSIGRGFENVLLHEMGHGFADLGDEYGGVPKCCPSLWTMHANTTVDTARAWLKWPVDPRVPIPTDSVGLREAFPATPASELLLMAGLWEGAVMYDSCVYRPHFTCRMREEQADFCTVCSGAIDCETQSRCLEITTLDLPLPEEGFRCPAEAVFRIPLDPCLKCLAVSGAAAIAEFDFSEKGDARVEVGPLPGVETVYLTGTNDRGRHVVAELTEESAPPDQNTMFSVTFAIEDGTSYCIEFSPVDCKEEYFTPTVRILVNGQDVPTAFHHGQSGGGGGHS